ncbi:MAG TPA: hypothetical protein VHT29_11595 [Solirubrobacteraceae bacterium]|nr:hypothetical protein [Solirubrobacteraceae bacterium]
MFSSTPRRRGGLSPVHSAGLVPLDALSSKSTTGAQPKGTRAVAGQPEGCFMKRVKSTVVVVVVAAFAFAALGVASASAADPEFAFTTFPNKFTGTSTTTPSFTVEAGTYFCTAASITGEITGPKEVSKIVMTFAGSPCATSLLCKNVSGKNEWKTKELKGRLGYINKASHTVGLLLEPTTEPIAECEDGWLVQGSIIGGLGPVNNQVKEFSLSFATAEEKQQFTHFEGEEVMHNLKLLRTGEKSSHVMLLSGAKMSLTTSSKVAIIA